MDGLGATPTTTFSTRQPLSATPQMPERLPPHADRSWLSQPLLTRRERILWLAKPERMEAGYAYFENPSTGFRGFDDDDGVSNGPNQSRRNSAQYISRNMARITTIALILLYSGRH